MSTKVKFWQGNKGIAKAQTHICFSGLSYCKPFPTRVVYLIPFDKAINKNQINFYLNFLDNILDKSIYRYKIINESKHFPNHLMFTIQTKGLDYTKLLVYLTAFRYLDEYPEIIQELFKFSDSNDLNDLFIKFQTIHFNYKNLKNKRNGNLEGHGLISYYWDKEFSPITLNEFKYNLHEQNLRKVHAYFQTKTTELGDKYKNLKFSYTKFTFPIDNPA